MVKLIFPKDFLMGKKCVESFLNKSLIKKNKGKKKKVKFVKRK